MSSGAKIQRDERKRRGHEVTLSDEVWAKLGQLAKKHHRGNRSAAIEAMTLAASLVIVLFLAGCGGADGGPIGDPMVAPVQSTTLIADGGAPHVQVDSGVASDRACVLLACAAYLPQCDVTENDGCGGTIYCACPGTTVDSGTAEVDAVACVPVTCADMGIPGGGAYTTTDGCGHTLNCPALPDAPTPDAGSAACNGYLVGPHDCLTCLPTETACITSPPNPDQSEWAAPECCTGYCAVNGGGQHVCSL